MATSLCLTTNDDDLDLYPSPDGTATPPSPCDITFDVASEMESSVYALSHLNLFQPGCPNRHKNAKYLPVMDGIALLLVHTTDEGDMAAMSFERLSTGIKFWYAKNRPCTSEEKEFINGLVQVFKERAKGAVSLTDSLLGFANKGDVEEVNSQEDILPRLLKKRIIPFCLPRIHALFKKLWYHCSSKPELPKYPKRPGSQATRKFRERVKEEEFPLAKDVTLDFAFSILLTFAQRVTKKTQEELQSGSEKETIAFFLGICCYLFEAFKVDNYRPFTDDELLLSTIETLGKYYKVSRTLSDLAATRKKPEVDWITTDFTFEEVISLPEPPRVVRIPKHSLTKLVNVSSRTSGYKGMPMQTLEDIAKVYGLRIDLHPNDDSFMNPTNNSHCSGTIKHFTKRGHEMLSQAHCVATLALHMISQRKQRSSIENLNPIPIGISTGSCCWICEKYMACLYQCADASPDDPEASERMFLVSHLARKFPPMWAFPPDTPDETIEGLEMIVRQVVAAIGWHVSRHSHEGLEGTHVTDFEESLVAMLEANADWEY